MKVVEPIRDPDQLNLCLKKQGGSVFEVIGNFFAGSQGSTLISISSDMATFGTNIGTLAAGIENIDVTAVNFEGAKKLFENFKDFSDTVSQYGEINQSNQMSNLLWMLDDFGSHLALFQMNLGSTDVSSLSTAASIIETLVNLAASATNVDASNVSIIGSILEEYGKISFQGFVTGFSEASGDAITAVNDLLTQISSAIQNDKTVSGASVSLSEYVGGILHPGAARLYSCGGKT